MLLRNCYVEDPCIIQIYKHIEELINEYSKKIFDEAKKHGFEVTNNTSPDHVLSKLSNESELGVQYNSLLKMRKYVTAMSPIIVKQYLERFSEITIEEISLIKNIPVKLEILPKLIEKSSKSIIICSFIPTTEIIQKYFEELHHKVFLLSRMTYDKDRILDEFKQYTGLKAVLVISQLGEVDLLIPDVELIIFFDSADTTKILYHCIKQLKKGEIICLSYSGTNEQEKILRIFTDIHERYPELQIET